MHATIDVTPQTPARVRRTLFRDGAAGRFGSLTVEQSDGMLRSEVTFHFTAADQLDALIAEATALREELRTAEQAEEYERRERVDAVRFDVENRQTLAEVA